MRFVWQQPIVLRARWSCAVGSENARLQQILCHLSDQLKWYQHTCEQLLLYFMFFNSLLTSGSIFIILWSVSFVYNFIADWCNTALITCTGCYGPKFVKPFSLNCDLRKIIFMERNLKTLFELFVGLLRFLFSTDAHKNI